MSCLIIIGLCIFGVIWLEIKRVTDIDVDTDTDTDVDDNDFTPDE
jgi:hypothetical protein